MMDTNILAGIDQALASVPTLPMGQGALILIVGGIFAAGVSLVWTVLMPREVPVQAAQRGWPHARTTKAASRSVPMRDVSRRFPAGGHAPGSRRAPSPVTASRPKRGGVPGLAWLGQISMVTQKQGLGSIEPVAIWDDDHCHLRLTECRSCRSGGKSAGCEVERQLLEDEVERFIPDPQVVEVHCRARAEEACVFDVQAGGTEGS